MRLLLLSPSLSFCSLSKRKEKKDDLDNQVSIKKQCFNKLPAIQGAYRYQIEYVKHYKSK